MKDTNLVVTIKLAQLARLKNFDEICDYGYCYDTVRNSYYTNYDADYFHNSGLWEKHYAAPTREQLNAWLRSKNIFVTIDVDRTLEPKFAYTICRYITTSHEALWVNCMEKGAAYSDLYYTYEAAFEDALEAALNLL